MNDTHLATIRIVWGALEIALLFLIVSIIAISLDLLILHVRRTEISSQLGRALCVVAFTIAALDLGSVIAYAVTHAFAIWQSISS